MRRLMLGGLFALVVATVASAQPQTVGVMVNDPGAFVGYTLFNPLQYTSTYLIDNEGRLINEWSTPYPIGNMAYILDDGSLMRTADPGGNDVFVMGGDAGLVQRLAWDGTVLWEFLYSDSTVRAHHDVEVLPNGNVLMIAWEYRSLGEAIQAGRDPLTMGTAELWPDKIIEVEPVGTNGGNIVWEWKAWDHLIQDFDATKDNFGVVADHPELIDLNYFQDFGADWLHFNAIDYNADLDQIVVSVPRFDEFWVIDHSTTTAEAAGHTGGDQGKGGDLLYRWGSPQAYGRGTSTDQQLFRQHDVHWIPAGSPGAGRIQVFNNGPDRPAGQYSTIEEIETPVDMNGAYPALGVGQTHGPAAPTATYVASPPESFYSGFISGSQKLPNGNLLIMEGATGRSFEVDDQGTIVWEYEIPVNNFGPVTQGNPPGNNGTFRVHRYAPDYAGLVGQDLTPGDVIELPNPAVSVPVIASSPFGLRAAPNPFRARTKLSFDIPQRGHVDLAVFNVQGRRIAELMSGTREAGLIEVDWASERLPAGVYQVALSVNGRSEAKQIVHLP